MPKKIIIIKSFILAIAFLLVFSSSISEQPNVEAKAKKLNMSYVYFGEPDIHKKYVERTKGCLHVISPNYFNIEDDGTLELTSALNVDFINEMHERNIKVIPFLSNHWNRELGRKALENREILTEEIAEAIKKYNLDGINVDIENLTEIDRSNYTDFVKLLREKLSEEKVVSVAVAANPKGLNSGWHGSYDYELLGKYSDYLMLMTYDESYQGSEPGPVASLSFVEESIKYALKRVPNEKIVLGIPFFGRYWKKESDYGGYGISLTDVNTLIQKYNGQVLFDTKSKSPRAIITIRPEDESYYVFGRKLTPGKYTIWFENEKSIKYKLRLVQKYNLKGSGSWSLGQETKDTWNYYDIWLNGHYFADVEGHWAQTDIWAVKEKGWMEGVSDTHFFPDKPLTRVEAAVTLVRAMEIESNKTKPSFKDIPKDHWAEREIAIAQENGLILGDGKGNFLPEKHITREEMAVLLDRIFFNDTNIKTERTPFIDVKEKRWSYNAIIRMKNEGIFIGYKDNTFYPEAKITRAQMATLMNRISHYIEK
ncbi:glycosyl hydrolase family 18 protein [Thermohalobacter berrensis]|uniref:Glycoside hydrolase n=1 Tax=Thermohalobacter berrensis TaxID=99594 RepID=A0A419SWF0_9FIRM|nr:glycosyl hydrolase family 18 protein [Thermohalobacter berrensis]RKD29573.1 glycoside hydrolase [Thermohalobacter berrensis]